jgi:xanthine dehydrogenase accessory factor
MLPKPKSAGRSPSAMLVAFLRPPTLQLNKGRALARNLGDNYVGNEHLLFALTQQHEDIFEQLDIDPEQLLDILEAQFPKFSSSDRPQAPAPVKPEKISTSEPMDEKDIFRAIAEAETAGQPIALATVVRTEGSMPRHAGSKLLVYADGRIVGTVGGGAMEARVVEEAKTAIKEGKPRINTYTLNDLKAGDPGVCGGTADIFIDPLFVRPTLVVIGCGHVGKALAELAKWAGFRVIVSDDRGELCNPQHIPNMDEYIVTPPNAVHQHVELGPHTYVAALTRGLPIDIDLFPPLLQAEVPYLGLIGSRRRWALTTKELEARGFTKEQLARVRAPIGLELEAETPHEIAVSILAEIIMLRNGGTGKPMQWMGSAEAVSE